MSQTPLLEIRNLHARVAGHEILKGLSLTIGVGEIHAIMGPNGSGKSTLSQVLAGHPAYEITEGEVLYKGKNLLEMEPEERSCEGVFLAFQYPIEIPGVSNSYFLRTALNEQRKYKGLPEIDGAEFIELVTKRMEVLEMDPALLTRSLNEGFSGGQKKRNEILQMLVLEPSLCLLDETDSGLDIDALREVSKGVNWLRAPGRSMILVTHYQRLLDHITPDHIHVLAKGRIIRSGGAELALELEKRGYDWLLAEAGL
jgi:Fe-S cluster assembly ATP-binding protein